MADHLKRKLGLGLLTAYGVGIMVGAGIYVLVGAAAGEAGVWAPVSFLLAALVAVPTALSFAELSARIPEAAGDSSYVEVGLNKHWLALVVGAINVGAGTFAASAVLRGGVGYLTSITPIPFEAGIILLGILLTAIAVIGVVESLGFAAVLTVIEVVGLVLVIWAGFGAEPVEGWINPPTPYWPGIFAASIFAFFAFIGFDDLVNMAEEAKNPGFTMPASILISLAITAALYALVSMAAVRAVPQEALAVSERPLALVWETARGQSAAFLSAIAVAAALNGVLAQIVMAARVLFGLGRRSPSLAMFHHAHPRFGTPVRASILIGAAVVAGALLLPVAALAELTSVALLAVFAIVNTALIALKRKAPEAPFKVWTIVPWFGLLACLAAFAAALGQLL
ncbi:APC family permease [Actibacterium sp. XHP0104]|uniref:APC family permease n=1 Tax=Actibacterium sp. XHP0104 TaxID=2984335 RepID=UPI0021E738EB|nr:APC family permease [Actibacterium sp. XHP0104]MCV2881331.1 APC family permease [Actibacterium sp. XHP0104]